MTNQHRLFIVLIAMVMAIVVGVGCQNPANSTNDATTNSGAAITENEASTTETPQDSEFPNKLSNGIPVYHAVVGINDTVGGARLKFLRDTAVYALQNKFTYIDKNSILRITEQPDALATSDLHPNVAYFMKLHLYDGLAPTGNNFQVIQVSFNNSEATSVSRAAVADRPDYYVWDKKIDLELFPTCNSSDVSCKARNMIGNIARLSLI